MDTMIIKSKIWKNADKSETRYFVEAFRGEYEKKRGELVAVIHHGTFFKNGNTWNKAGTYDGNLTAEEWQLAKEIGNTPGTWTAFFHPRYNDIVRGGTDYRPFDEAKKEASALAERQAVRAKRDPRLDTALDVAGYGAIGSFLKVTDTYNNIVNILIVLDTYEFAEEDEQSSSDRRQSGWYMRCVEPNETEKKLPEYIALAEKLVAKEKHHIDIQVRSERIQTNEPDEELFNQLFGNGELDN